MNENLQILCEKFTSNANLLKHTFKWDGEMQALAGSALFTQLNQRVNVEKLKECDGIIKNRHNFLSDFRGNTKLPLICKMAINANPEKYFTEVESVYKQLNNDSIIGSDYLMLAAMIICDHGCAGNAEFYAAKTNENYKKMKKARFLLTSRNDVPFAAIVSVKNADADALLKEAERCYSELKNKFGFGNNGAIMSLCRILSLNSGATEEKCRAVTELFNGFKAAKHRFGIGRELSYLGILSMLETEKGTLIKEICEADDFLRIQKGFGALDISNSTRRMYAAMLATSLHVEAASNGTAEQTAELGNMLAASVSIELAVVMTMMVITWST